MMYDIGGERLLLVHHKDKEIIRKKNWTKHPDRAAQSIFVDAY